MTIVRLIAPDYTVGEARHREVAFVLENFIYYERDVYSDGRESIELMCHMGMCVTFSNRIYTPESWEKFIRKLEAHFSELETSSHTPPSGTKPDLNYYY